MRRLVLALSTLVVGLVVSSCAVGVRQPASEVTKTSATLNGNVFSTTGGAGSWYFEYGTTEARTERTPTRSIDFEAGEIEPVSEPIDGLEPGTVYHFAACAEDFDNGGEAFCSPDKTFRTQPDIKITLTEDCSFYPPDHGVDPLVTGLVPNSEFFGALDRPSLGRISATLFADDNGSFDISTFTDPAAGTWRATVEFEGQIVTESLFVDCEGGTS
jgi:hypothetical protein